ncbi:MAG: hypothetical protein LLF76_13790 [Planctomycetaceae bacterium]|nr:hypothetical protein [Planctomycetaceae bacterium]
MKMRFKLAGVLAMLLIPAAVAADQPNVPDQAAAEQYVKATRDLASRRIFEVGGREKIDLLFAAMLPVINSVDAYYATGYKDEISKSLQQCLSNTNMDINQQIIGKGLQHVTVQAIRRELDIMAAAAAAGRKASGERIKIYFEHIRPTFVRRDKGFFGDQKPLETAADQSIQRLIDAPETEFLSASRDLEDVIARTIALSVLYEAGELEKSRDTDLHFCDIKKTEATVYYRIIQSRIQRRSPKTNETILAMLNGNYASWNAVELEKYMVRGLAIPLK